MATKKEDSEKLPQSPENNEAVPQNGSPQPSELSGACSTPDYYDQLLRLKAEFENFRKRTDRERPEWVRIGEAGLLAKMLPLYDLLLQAHDQMVKQSSDGGVSSKELIQGLELIFKEFSKIFESEGVHVIETVGKPYHHDLHEVLGFVETNEYPEGAIAQELERGYTFHGKVLRPARVRTAKPKKSE